MSDKEIVIKSTTWCIYDIASQSVSKNNQLNQQDLFTVIAMQKKSCKYLLGMGKNSNIIMPILLV